MVARAHPATLSDGYPIYHHSTSVGVDDVTQAALDSTQAAKKDRPPA